MTKLIEKLSLNQILISLLLFGFILAMIISSNLKDFKKNGMEITGVNKRLNLVEIIELKNHPWFLGTQYHPEYKSTVLNPHPLFISFVKKIKTLKNGQ